MTPQTIGKYNVIKALGVGGFGAVYLAEDPKLKGQVAIKVFSPRTVAERTVAERGHETEELLRERFLREATLLRQLSSNANIVDVYDFDEMSDGTPYFVMPYLERSLVDEIGKDVLTTEALNELPSALRPRKLPMLRVIEVLTEVLSGLSAVHEAGLIHRDIKPANILFDVHGRAQLCDFGVAKIPDVQHSETGVVIGSRNYMSPEQRESTKHVTPRSDVYSVGVIAYRLLTGSLPIGPCDDPVHYCPEMGADFNRLVLSSLSPKQENRPENAGEFLRCLQQATRTDGAVDGENNASDDTVTEMGPAPRSVRDDLENLEQSIESFLLTNAEIDDSQYKQLKMMASIEKVSDGALQHLISRVEQRLAPQIKPIQAFIVLVEEALTLGNGKLSLEAKNQLRQAGKAADLAMETADAIISKRQQSREIQNRKAFRQKALGIMACFCMGFLGWYFLLHDSSSSVTRPTGQRLAGTEAVQVGTVETAESGLESAEIKGTKIDPIKELKVYTTMLSIPGGRFDMGGDGHSKVEQPKHSVSVESFQLGETEVTWDQFQACIDAGFCPNNISDQGWGKGNRPVINVSWNEVQTYIRWLNQETGQRFRLPSEAEWEYSARAGSPDNYSWGEEVGSNRANCDGCGSQWDDKKTAPVASFSANAYGLFDMHGNVWEWVQDCWHDNYRGAPSDGSAWQREEGTSEEGSEDACGRRVLRGGSWHNVKGYLRSASRSADGVANRYFNFGFRLAHD